MSYIPQELHEVLGEKARQPWREHAACKGRPDLIAGGHGAEQRRTVCFTCPVIHDCRSWALALPPGADTDDIAGGLTAQQRHAERNRAGTHKTAEAVETNGETVTVHAITPPPAEVPTKAAEPAVITNLEILLRRGEQSDSAATRASAKRARAAVEDLRQRINAEDAEKQVRERIASLQQQLAAAQEQLRDVRPKKTAGPRPAVPDGIASKDVRAWAKERGIPCPSHGRIPKVVVDQYTAAHGLADA